MKGKYLIIAFAIACHGAYAMSPSQEAQKREKLRNIISQLETAKTDAQATRLKAQGDSIINELSRAGRPMKKSKLTQELADADKLSRASRKKAALGREISAASASRTQRMETRSKFGQEVAVAGTIDQRIRNILTNVVSAINGDIAAAGNLINEHVFFTKNPDKTYNFTNAEMRQPRHLVRINKHMDGVIEAIDGYFDQFTDILNDLSRDERNKLKAAGAFRSYKNEVTGAIQIFVARLQAAVLNNIEKFKDNSDIPLQKKNANEAIRRIVSKIAKFYEKTNELGITNINIIEFKSKYGIN